MKPNERYAVPAIVLHWLVAGLIIATFIWGLVVADMPLSPAKFKYIAWHKWAGITVLALVAVRLLVRVLKRPPELPAHMNGRTPAGAWWPPGLVSADVCCAADRLVDELGLWLSGGAVQAGATAGSDRRMNSWPLR
jgi:hypothetical protein